MGQLNSTITIEQNEYRSCEVRGVKALFHRYVEDTEIYIKNELIHPAQEKRLEWLKSMIREDNIVPRGCDIEKINKTLALVEYGDGTVHKVDPTIVKFLDTKEKFAGFDEEVCDAEEK